MTTYVEAKNVEMKLRKKFEGQRGIYVGITGTRLKGHRVEVRLIDEADVSKVPTEMDGVAVDTQIIDRAPARKQ